MPGADPADARRFNGAEVEALIFDFDRTLVPLGNFVRWRAALVEMEACYRAAGIPEQVIASAPRGCFGLFRHVSLTGVLDGTALARVQEQASQVLARFEEEGVGRAALYAGAEALLRALPAMALRAAIVSSNPRAVIRAILERERVSDCFAAVVGRDGLAQIKPAPDGMLRCCAELGLEPARCLGIGDNRGDVVASLAAGMPAVGVATGVSTREELLAAGAGAVFPSLDALHEKLRTELLRSHPPGS